MHICPTCGDHFDVHGDAYQVNDYTEDTYCSYECSAVALGQALQREGITDPIDVKAHMEYI